MHGTKDHHRIDPKGQLLPMRLTPPPTTGSLLKYVWSTGYSASDIISLMIGVARKHHETQCCNVKWIQIIWSDTYHRSGYGWRATFGLRRPQLHPFQREPSCNRLVTEATWALSYLLEPTIRRFVGQEWDILTLVTLWKTYRYAVTINTLTSSWQGCHNSYGTSDSMLGTIFVLRLSARTRKHMD